MNFPILENVESAIVDKAKQNSQKMFKAKWQAFAYKLFIGQGTTLD